MNMGFPMPPSLDKLLNSRRPRGADKQQTAADTAKKKLQQFVKSDKERFTNDVEILDLFKNIVIVRRDGEEFEWNPATKKAHKLINKSYAKNIYLIHLFKQNKLTKIEKEIIIILILSNIGILPDRVDTVNEMQAALLPSSSDALKVMQLLQSDGKLIKNDLVTYEADTDNFIDTSIYISNDIIDNLMSNTKRRKKDNSLPCKTYDDLLKELYGFIRIVKEKCEALDYVRRGAHYNIASFHKQSRSLHKWMWKLAATLKKYKKWPLAEYNFYDDESIGDDKLNELIILLILMVKELGYLAENDDVYNGLNLSMALSEQNTDIYPMATRYLSKNSRLRKDNIIRVCSGTDDVSRDDPNSLMYCEFELTNETLSKLKLKRASNMRRHNIRSPHLTMKQLVFSEHVKDCIDMIIKNAENHSVLMDDWGIGETIRYGRGLILLFSGIPGTGKTAAAEAIAHHLNTPILTADYSKIQNAWVGETEKNIVQTFNAAKESGSLLFWDEADAMFFDRDSAHRNFEVRDVNVLLQEVEKYEGICVLATNRKIVLDKAFERRISLKVEFDRPTYEMRREIWKRSLPKSLPIDKSVTLDKLAVEELVGGEIKNVIINAARLAVTRNKKGPITMEDFNRAFKLEKQGKWNKNSAAKIGFSKNQ